MTGPSNILEKSRIPLTSAVNEHLLHCIGPLQMSLFLMTAQWKDTFKLGFQPGIRPPPFFGSFKNLLLS